ncbi:hypothetical protein CHUAL_006835 [Chamberlinius hualienensis]
MNSNLGWLLVLIAIGCCFGNDLPFKLNYLEMNYDLGDDTIHWPPVRPFTIVKSTSIDRGGYWASNKEFCSNEHVGTHIDAPSHYAKGQWSVDKIPFERLVDRPAVKIDISNRAEESNDTYLDVHDLVRWESQYGEIAKGSVVLMYSGWGKRFWPNKEKYFGTKTLNDTSTYHFPGFHPDAAKWLIEHRNIYGIGVDSASGDRGQNNGSLVHRLINSNNIYILENVANLHLLPEYGALITAMPMKIRGGTGGPARIFARLLPYFNEAVSRKYSWWTMLIALVSLALLY